MKAFTGSKMSDGQVSLRPLEYTYVQDMADLADNPYIWNNVRDYFPNPYTKNDAKDFIEMILTEVPIATFGIFYHNDFSGIAGLRIRKDVYRYSAEIGYWLGAPFWNKGIATSAVNLLVYYGFNELGLIRIDAGIFEYNKASCRVLEKAGFVKEGIFQSGLVKNGKVWNEVRFGIVNPQQKI